MNVNREPEYNRIMNTYRKIANRGHEEDGRRGSRDWCGRLSRRAARVKKLVNRLAKQREARQDMKEQLES